LIIFAGTNAFIPQPLIADGGRTSDSITHTEITELGFIRSLARFFYDTRIRPNNNNGDTVNEAEYFITEHTIDDLYKLAYPEYNAAQIMLYSLPLEFNLDYIMTYNVLVDFNPNTKTLPAAHFDSEAFINSSKRILQLRKTIVDNARDTNNDLFQARQSIGQLLHTLQDFYSHSNWIEMGKTNINDLIGVSENIGAVAGPNQATCTNNGCTRIEQKCSLWQLVTIRECPLVYYDCKNNILPEINNQQLLTSGYAQHQHNENNDPVNKPTNVEKCSHGSVLDSLSHIPAVGGINKDGNSVLFSPHHHLHFQAVNLAVKATERFFNDLRRDLGDDNFDRLFLIHPTETQRQAASNAVADGQRFRFFTPGLSTSLEEDDGLFTKLKKSIKQRIDMIKSILTNMIGNKNNLDVPTYDLSDQGVDVKDENNFRAAPYIFGSEFFGRKKRFIDILRQRR